MTDLSQFFFLRGVNWREWVERWDRMQEQHLPRRDERFQLMLQLVAETQTRVRTIFDLGCGTGSLMLQFLERFPEAEVFGIDFDPVLVVLAHERLAAHRDRARIIHADLRTTAWIGQVPAVADAIVSATALHWLTRNELVMLYGQVARLVRADGIFLNADHVASDCAVLQRVWEKHREDWQKQSAAGGERWEGFWKAYTSALNLPGSDQIHQRVLGGWKGGVEEGLPLVWHFDQLRQRGFRHVDCFWRLDADAIYGGIR